MNLFQLSRQGLRFRDVPLVGGLSQVRYTVEACRWLYQPAFCYARTFRNTRAVVDYVGAYLGGRNSDEGVGGLTEAPTAPTLSFSHWKMVHCSLFEQQKSPAMEGALTIVMLTLQRNNDNNNSFSLHPNGNLGSAKFAKITNFWAQTLAYRPPRFTRAGR